MPLDTPDQETIKNHRFFFGKAHPLQKFKCIGNALVVNTSEIQKSLFSKNTLFEFENYILRYDYYESRAACCVRLIHPQIGVMKVFSLHLDHVLEPTRIAQLNKLKPILDQENVPHVIMGDFNALTKQDYTTEYEAEVRAVRESGNWELPHYDVTALMVEWGYIDLWAKINPTIKDQDVKTCEYSTRIDYIWVSKSMDEKIDYEKTTCRILDEVHFSDHFPVLASIVFKDDVNPIQSYVAIPKPKTSISSQ